MYRSIVFKAMKHVVFKTSEAAAIERRAMETETIQKNGASPKSQMSRRNFLVTLCGALFAAGILFSGCSKDDTNPLLGLWAFKESNVIYYFDGESYNLKENGGDLTDFNQSFRGWSIEFAANTLTMGMGGQTSQPMSYTLSGNIITIKDGATTILWRYNVSGKTLELVWTREMLEMLYGSLPDELYLFDEIEFILTFNKVK